MKPMTHSLQIALFMALCLLTGQNVFADPVPQLFEVEVSRGFSGLIELKDGRLFAVDLPLNGWISSDEGHTWKKTGPLLDSRGERIPASSDYLVSMVRLASGAIGVKGTLRQPGIAHSRKNIAPLIDGGFMCGRTDAVDYWFVVKQQMFSRNIER